MTRLFEMERLPLKEMLTFGILPSRIKNILLRRRGHDVHRSVRWGIGSVILGDRITIGRDVEIGHGTIMRGRSISIGERTRIGSLSFLDCPRISIGSDAKLNEYVFVGGLVTKDSSFDLGSRTIVMQYSFINTTQPVVIGDDSGVGGHCLIFTHASWLSELEGYPVTFAPVHIGKSVWLPWRVFLLPGASLGDGCVIGANSVVRGEIPPRSLAVGSPAKVVRQDPDFPRHIDEAERMQLFAHMMDDLVSFFEFMGGQMADATEGRLTFRRDGSVNQLQAISSEQELEALNHMPSPSQGKSPTLYIYLLDPPLSGREEVPELSRKSLGIDLIAKTRWGTFDAFAEEVALFFERYGIRLERTPSR